MQRLIATTENVKSAGKRHSFIAALLISGALTVIAAQPAFATVTTTNLSLQSFGFSYSSVTGGQPTIVDNGVTDCTSNAGCVTTEPLPYTFAFTGPGASVTPPDPLFVVRPSGTGSATIQVTFNFLYNSNPFALIEKVNYTAYAPTDFDSLIWQAGTNGTCNGSQTTYAANTACTYAFTIAGQNFSIKMDNETDWDMAEFDAASVDVGPAKVPEPASIAMFGAGLLGFGMLWRRRRQKTAATAV